jgi:PAS domain S-box-containing protein
MVQSILDASSASLCVLDEQGTILATNEAWRRFARENPPTPVDDHIGLNYLSVCDAVTGPDAMEAIVFAKGLRSVINGSIAEFTREYPCHSPKHQGWFIGKATRLVQGGSWRVIVAHENITERRLAQESLRQSEERFRKVLDGQTDVTERKQMQESLQWSEKRYRQLHESMMDAFVSVDMAGRLIEFNPSFQAMLGYSTEELYQLTYVDLTPAKWHAFEAGIVADQILPHGYSLVYQKEYRRKDGTTFPIELRTFLVRDNAGQPSSMWAIVRDITERRQLEEILRKSEERLRLVLKVSNDGLWDWDLRNHQAYFSPRYYEMIGYPPEEVTPNLDFYQRMVHPEDLPMVLETISAQLEGRLLESVFEHRLITKDGSVKWMLGKSKVVEHDAAGAPLRLVGTISDITTRKLAEAELRLSEAELTEAQRIAKLGSWSFDVTHNRVRWSEEMHRLFDLEKTAFAGRYEYFINRVHPDDRSAVRQVNEEARSTGNSFETQYRIVTRDGTIKTIREIGYSEKDANGQVVRLFGTAQDITARQQTEQELTRSREGLRALTARLERVREEERTRIAREIHDVLAQELTRLKMDIAWLNRRCSKPIHREQQEHFQQKLADMAALTDIAMESVQRIATELRPVVLDSLGLGAAIEWLAADFQTRSGIQCAVTLPDEEVALDSDIATGVFRVLQESLTNVARHSRAARVGICLRIEPGELILAVQDNGCGIQPDKLTDFRSVGLVGMRERALLAGGQCEIKSAPGKGTSVQMRVPYGRTDKPVNKQP